LRLVVCFFGTSMPSFTQQGVNKRLKKGEVKEMWVKDHFKTLLNSKHGGKYGYLVLMIKMKCKLDCDGVWTQVLFRLSDFEEINNGTSFKYEFKRCLGKKYNDMITCCFVFL
jgi:hypothetical protein